MSPLYLSKLLEGIACSLITTWLLFCCNPYRPHDYEERLAYWHEFEVTRGYNLNSPDKHYFMPEELSEISGLSYYQRNVLACVQDEDGKIYLYDIKDERVTERINFAKSGDYEGIQVVGESVYVVESNGDLYNYLQKQDKTEVIDTPLRSSNNIEGLGLSADGKSLLIACKGDPDLKDQEVKGKAIYSYSLSEGFDEEPAYNIRKKQVEEWVEERNPPWELSKSMLRFMPSGLAVHPKTGELYIVAFQGKVMIILNNRGEIQEFIPLPNVLFKQPEGICFAPNGDLYISNEGRGGQANILMFRYGKQ